MNRFDKLKVAVWTVVIVACLAAWWGIALLVTS